LSDTIEGVAGLSTGNIALDWAMTCGGLPKGRITELYGLQSSGKTTTALQAAAIAQEQGTNIVYLDYENSLDPAYCKALGLDPYDSTFQVAQPGTFEEGIDALRKLVDTGEVGLVIVDSVAAMVTRKEMELETGSESDFGRKAKMMAATMRQIGGPLARTGTVAVFLNHVRDVIDTNPMTRGADRKTTPGGSALKFHASMRLHFKVIGSVTTDGESALSGDKERQKVANKVTVLVEKNKVGPPFRKAELRLTFGHGFSAGWNILQVLLAHGRARKRPGGYYEFIAPGGEILVERYHGEAEAVEAIEGNLTELASEAAALLEADDGSSVAPPSEDATLGTPSDADTLLESP
jgi:recombination protein RecA